MTADLREIFAATTREQALRTAETVAARWEPTHPAVARLLDEAIEDCLAFLALALAHRARIRTTNGMERLHEEIKRRTPAVPHLPQPGACLRLVTSLCVEQSDDSVSGRRYIEIRDRPPGMGGVEVPMDQRRDYPPEQSSRSPWQIGTKRTILFPRVGFSCPGVHRV